jgi:DNA polymerase III alpha subunit
MWINTKQDLITGILNHGPDVLENAVIQDLDSDILNYLERILSEKLNYPTPITVDQISKNRDWFIPDDYYPNLTEMLYGMCETKEQTDRVSQELELYIKNDMLDVLFVMKYIVDTLRANNVVWGVGRGSSVASYVLYLIGVHKVDSIKYNLPIEEFFKGEQNG